MHKRSPERLVLPPGVELIRPMDALARISGFIDQCPGLWGISMIGRKGDTEFIRCRPSRELPDGKIRDMLNAALHRFDLGDPPDDPLETIIAVPGMRQFSLRETKKRIEQFLTRCPDMTLVVLLCKGGNVEKTRRLAANISKEGARAMLRRANSLFERERTHLITPLT